MRPLLEPLLWTSAVFSSLGVPAVFGLFLLGSRAMRRHDGAAAPRPRPLQETPAPARPGVTLLKPCAGLDDDLEECLESYCALSYPTMQLLLGVRDERDPAYPVLCRVKSRHPELDIEVVVTRETKVPSPKISNVEVLHRRAKYPLLWMTDSNTRVHPDTLADLVDALDAPGVGMAVSPVVSSRAETAGAKLDALTLDVFVGLTTFSIYQLLGMVTTPGKSVLFREETLRAVGGWSFVGQFFGEDIVFMEAVRSLGLRLALGRFAVENVTKRTTVARYRARHLRWAQIRWRFSPPGAAFEPLLAPLVPALVLALACPSRASALLLAVAFAEQLLLDLAVLRRVRGAWPRASWLPWIVLRPLFAFYLTLRGVYAGRVDWRGNALYMGARSRCLDEPALRHWWRSVAQRSSDG